jgi:hypothetical protein
MVDDREIDFNKGRLNKGSNKKMDICPYCGKHSLEGNRYVKECHNPFCIEVILLYDDNGVLIK